MTSVFNGMTRDDDIWTSQDGYPEADVTIAVRTVHGALAARSVPSALSVSGAGRGVNLSVISSGHVTFMAVLIIVRWR